MSLFNQRGLIKGLTLAVLLATSAASAQQLGEVLEKKCVLGDCIDGRGTLEILTPIGKAEYFGEFEAGEFHGYGRLTVPLNRTQQSIYVGRWQQGVRTGRGKFWDGKADLYIGLWQDDMRNGEGAYFFNLGVWRENEHSEFWLKDNTENYSGDFLNDHYHGIGVFRWANGTRYEGDFFAGKKHGSGTFYYANGVQRKQVWEYGDFVR